MEPYDLISENGYYRHASSVVEAEAMIGEGTCIWHFCHVMRSARIGSNCNIGQNVFVDRDVVIGNGVKVQNNVSLYKGVSCADDVFIGPSVVFTNVINPRSFIERKDEFRPTLIGKGASLGANSTIVCGCSIGEYALVGAGAVVSRDVKPYALVVGNPARQIGWVSRDGENLHFTREGIAECPRSGHRYRLSGGVVTRI